MGSRRGLNTNSPSNVDPGRTGLVRKGNGFVSIPYNTLQQMLTDAFNLATVEQANNPMSPSAALHFQQLVNGVFQAEGHWGGYITNHSTLRFRPLMFISQHASVTSLAFFAKLNAVLPNTLVPKIMLTKQGYWHIRFEVRDWDTIIKVVMPYFSFVFGEKFTAMAKLVDIYTLQGSTSQADRIKFMWLVYNLTTALNAVRRVPLQAYLDRINLAHGTTFNMPDYSVSYPDNSAVAMSFMFVLGLFLGDGNIYIRMRDAGNGVMLIPIFRITQSNTVANVRLMELVADCLVSVGLNAKLFYETHYVGVKAEGLNAFTDTFMVFIKQFESYFYWKAPQLVLLTRVITLMSIKPKSWLEAQLAIVRSIYDVLNERTFSLSHWIDRLTALHNIVSTLPAGTSYVTPILHKGSNEDNVKSWMVKLPVTCDHVKNTLVFLVTTMTQMLRSKQQSNTVMILLHLV